MRCAISDIIRPQKPQKCSMRSWACSFMIWHRLIRSQSWIKTVLSNFAFRIRSVAAWNPGSCLSDILPIFVPCKSNKRWQEPGKQVTWFRQRQNKWSKHHVLHTWGWQSFLVWVSYLPCRSIALLPNLEILYLSIDHMACPFDILVDCLQQLALLNKLREIHLEFACLQSCNLPMVLNVGKVCSLTANIARQPDKHVSCFSSSLCLVMVSLKS